MTSGGGLFAGLSVAPASGSPSPPRGGMGKKQGAVGFSTANESEYAASAAAVVAGATANGGPAATTTAGPPSSPPALSQVRSAPLTDKLLGLLGGGGSENGGSSGTRHGPSSPHPVATPPSSTAAAAQLPPLTPGSQKSEETRRVLSSAFSMESSAFGSPVGNGLAAAENAGATATTIPVPGPPFSPLASRSRTSEAQLDGNPASPRVILEKRQPSLRGVGLIKADTPLHNGDVALRILRKFVARTRPHVPETHGGSQPLSLWTRYVSGTPAEYGTRFDAYQQLVDVIAKEETDGSTGEDRSEPGRGGEDGGVAAAPSSAPSSDGAAADAIVDAVLGESGDTMAKARGAMASFCHLMSVWSHASAHMGEAEKGGANVQAFCGIVATGYDTATSLVTHGCLDGVMIGIGPNRDEYHSIVEVLAESVFSSDLSQSETELSAMKFLLSTGCRVSTQDGQAMLRGSYLLQSIRVLYHVYLSTATEANKTTARASLQQLVTSVFIRMIASSAKANASASATAAFAETEEIPDETGNEGGEGPGPTATSNEPSFPSDDHRDAFLVLRSLCKLSMRNPLSSDRLSHAGLQTSASSSTWDASKDHPGGGNSGTGKLPTMNGGGGDGNGPGDPHGKDGPQPLYTHASIHPALESKILALDLLLNVLNNTNMKGSFLQDCGPQFHYAIRNYLCVSLLKNCTSDDTRVVNLSLRVFVPIFQNFRSILKTEIEAFVTNVFFVILDSKNSPVEHKSLVVTLFDEICSDPTTLAEIFLNYDCDLSAVDLFHRIVNALSKVARTSEVENSNANSTISLVAGSGAARMERSRSEYRELRLNAMRALRQVLASLHASIVEPMATTSEPHLTEEGGRGQDGDDGNGQKVVIDASNQKKSPSIVDSGSNPEEGDAKQSLVQIYDSKKKRREEESEIVLRFNQKPKAGIAYAAKCGHIDGSDPTDVARYLLKNKDRFEKSQIGDFLGREPEYENGFSLKVLHAYSSSMDFEGLTFDDAIRYYLSGFRLPGEAQKIDRIMEKFAERYTEQNPEAFATADVAFILSFSIIMLNTDLHNPAIKEERRMTKEGFIRNNRGISDGQDLPQEMLIDIFDRIRLNPISLKEDDDARERSVDTTSAASNALSPAVFFSSHYDEMEKKKESNFNKERDQIVRTTESLLKRRRHSTLDTGKAWSRRSRSNSFASKPQHVRYVRTDDSGLRDEYVAPMFEVTWGPALAAFSTAMESANGTVGALLAIASDEELEAAAVNAAETIEVCLTGFRFAIGTAGLVGNDTARDAYMLALSRFSQLGTGTLLEPRHVRCVQTMLALARSDGELLGSSWEHVFRALSEINRFHQLFQLMARNDRVVAAAAERRRSRLAERERRQIGRERRRAAKEASDSVDDMSVGTVDASSETDQSYGDASSLFDDSDDFNYNDEMDTKEIDEANARTVYEAVSEEIIEAIYERSSSMSTSSVKEFILQLCRVSRMEISNYGGHVGSDSNQVDLTKVQYRKHHELLVQTPSKDKESFHHHQTNIYNLQKLVEVTHYNMDSRPRLVFAELWTTVSAHLTSTALHSNPAVAIYAVDSFRQLCIQYLQREELGVFEFQRRFLKPLETVMARSEISITKELLLKCVERIILVFGSPQEGSKGGMLRSGWRPVLTVLGLAGRDPDEHIAKMGFELLTAQIQGCLDQCTTNGDDGNFQGVLLVERFVDLVDALLVYVEGPHEEMSLQCIDDMLKLCEFLADESTMSPLVRKRRTVASHGNEEPEGEANSSNQELELWWPILLGMSRSVGDPRKAVRRKSLESLLKVVSVHFFPRGQGASLDETLKTKKIQTLQLVFRGILSPVLEFCDVDPHHTRIPDLPHDFERFLTAPKPVEVPRAAATKPVPSWLDTTYDPFMDGCIQICLRSIEVFGQDTLVEEIFAMLNSCLISDSGAMAVKGLRRLEQFVSSDLPLGSLTDDTWATVSHMLRRCLSVRGISSRAVPISSNESTGSSVSGPDSRLNEDAASVDVEEPGTGLDAQESIREFIAEDAMFFDRRYIGSNAVSVIGNFLEGERFRKTLGLRWRLFLVSGLGKSVREWERAAAIILRNNSGKANVPRGQNPPSYLETAYYGRKWMNRFLLQVASMKEIEGTAAEGSRQAAAQSLVKEQTQGLVSAFLEKEAIVAGDGKKTSLDVKLFDRLMILVQDMLAGYGKLPNEHLSMMAWLNPVLSSCIHTSNEDIRLAIQKLVQRLH